MLASREMQHASVGHRMRATGEARVQRALKMRTDAVTEGAVAPSTTVNGCSDVTRRVGGSSHLSLSVRGACSTLQRGARRLTSSTHDCYMYCYCYRPAPTKTQHTVSHSFEITPRTRGGLTIINA